MMGVNHQNHNFLVLDLIALNIIYIYLMGAFLCFTHNQDQDDVWKIFANYR